MANRAVFLDKDGTLIENVPFNDDPARIRLLPGAAEGIRSLSEAGYRLFVVTNQPGIARGYFLKQAMAAIRSRLRELIADAGGHLGGFYYCPHEPGAPIAAYALDCDCRKPRPGLILRAAWEHDLDLHRSFMVGDILDDVEAGRRAGVKTILVNHQNETDWILSPMRLPHHVARDLAEAASWILSANHRVANSTLQQTGSRGP